MSGERVGDEEVREKKKRGGDEGAMSDEEAMGRESGIKRRMMRNFVRIGILMWQHLEKAKRILVL